ncbi:MAG TPA: ATP-dependent sacrificial sulfur transferase LarE [Nitrosopumilaceae archaeon]|nr:ATP-dependent sacrificial sulfur transferase LarE [Nitrosopumilaceae archaeon]
MKKIDELTHWFDDKKNALVALSGGVDSALVAYAAYRSLGTSSVAVTADYKTLAQDELESAKKISVEIGIKHIIIEYNELKNPDFVKNDKNRCFHCRMELSEHLKQIANKEKIDLIVDGTNLDDLGDYRPGIKALKENGIKSPLVETGFTKDEIRKEARRIGLSVYDRPSNSCLASRIPWGQQVTVEKLARIEIGETTVKQLFGIRQVRIRDLDGNARIEVMPEEIKLLSDKIKLIELDSRLKQIGFRTITIDPDGYRPGKLNVIAD